MNQYKEKMGDEELDFKREIYNCILKSKKGCTGADECHGHSYLAGVQDHYVGMNHVSVGELMLKVMKVIPSEKKQENFHSLCEISLRLQALEKLPRSRYNRDSKKLLLEEYHGKLEELKSDMKRERRKDECLVQSLRKLEENFGASYDRHHPFGPQQKNEKVALHGISLLLSLHLNDDKNLNPHHMEFMQRLFTDFGTQEKIQRFMLENGFRKYSKDNSGNQKMVDKVLEHLQSRSNRQGKIVQKLLRDKAFECSYDEEDCPRNMIMGLLDRLFAISGRSRYQHLGVNEEGLNNKIAALNEWGIGKFHPEFTKEEMALFEANRAIYQDQDTVQILRNIERLPTSRRKSLAPLRE